MLKSRDYSYDNKCLYLTSCDLCNPGITEENNLIVHNNVRDYTEGLCAHCVKTGTCAIARAEGGIWRCSDYIENE
ncbi:MAG: hypothetical protein ABRQ39_04170 [Candidatus Eremiobacterota bacterium]